MPFLVNRERCKTCIFGSNSPISRPRFDQLKKEWESNGAVQECHHATIKNRHIGCKGHYDAARVGAIENHPIIEAAAVGLGLTGLDIETVMQISERFGLVVFVDVESLPVLPPESDDE